MKTKTGSFKVPITRINFSQIEKKKKAYNNTIMNEGSPESPQTFKKNSIINIMPVNLPI